MVDANQTDMQLIDRVKEGDKKAFDSLVVKYQHRIIGLVSIYVDDFQEVQDVAQEVFINAYRAIHRFRGDSSFYTWLFRIAVNAAKSYLAKKARAVVERDVPVHNSETIDQLSSQWVIDTPENNLCRDEVEVAVYKAINSLPDELRTAVMLREFDGLSYDKIAEIMKSPIGTVRSRIFRARLTIDSEIGSILGRGS